MWCSCCKVLDELNFVQNIKHHFRAYGGWSFALTDYYALNFTAQLDNPNTQLMMDIVDPSVEGGAVLCLICCPATVRVSGAHLSLALPLWACASRRLCISRIQYVDILTMPKLIISTGGDEFLLPDNVDYFWSQLQGESHCKRAPSEVIRNEGGREAVAGTLGR